MKKTVYIIGLSIMGAAMTSCGKIIKIHTDKNLITKEISIGDAFNAIETYTISDIEYTDGPAKITIKAAPDIIDKIQIYVKDSVLVVTEPDSNSSGFRFDGLRARQTAKLTVSYPGVKKFTTYGVGDIKISPAETDTLILNTFGTGDITAGTIRCIKLFAQTAGTGDIELGSVSCTDADLYTQGTGDIDISDINAGMIKAETNGTGDITLKGKCRETSFGENGTGDINAKKLKTTD